MSYLRFRFRCCSFVTSDAYYGNDDPIILLFCELTLSAGLLATNCVQTRTLGDSTPVVSFHGGLTFLLYYLSESLLLSCKNIRV